MRHEKNTGYDDSLNDGFKAAASLGADIIFTFDADGEHDAADVPLVLAPYFGDGGYRCGTAALRAALGRADICGLYALSLRRFRPRLRIQGIPTGSVRGGRLFFDSFRSIGTELMIRGVGKGFRLALVPITLHERVDGRSRFYSFNLRGNMRMLRALWHVLWI